MTHEKLILPIYVTIFIIYFFISIFIDNHILNKIYNTGIVILALTMLIGILAKYNREYTHPKLFIFRN